MIGFSLRDFQPAEEVSLTIKDGETVLFGPSTYTMNGDGTYVDRKWM